MSAGGSPADPAARRSLEELCGAYRPAVYAYLRRRGCPDADAEDLTQGFFADLLSRNAFAAADASRGRFRAFLYASLDNFTANAARAERALKRGGGEQLLSLDRTRDADGGPCPNDWVDAGGVDPAAEFDRQWARCLIRQTLDQLREEYAGRGKQEWFDSLRPFLLASPTQAERAAAAERLGMTSTAFKVAVHRLRARYRQMLEAAVAETMLEPDEVGREFELLMGAFAKGKKSL